jgi:pseudouridine-5'-phosphate glycosidase
MHTARVANEQEASVPHVNVMMHPDGPPTAPLAFTEEVADALDAGRPVVALESNVITHGLAYPDNLATARRVQDAVRAGGGVPATIGIDAGRIMIGMTDADMERFASLPGIPKVSSRDMPVALATGAMGATTVASSLVAAQLAKIAFFASAGIGGVHRGAQSSMDISSDLVQFTRSKVAVVCAGAKSILDLQLTMEYLETHCVPVISYRSDDFPAFYCASSGIRSPHRLDDEAMIARVVESHWSLGNDSSLLITSPIRAQDAIDSREVDAALARAMVAAEDDGVSGNALTKYLMRAVDRATEGRSAKANMSVLVSTAELAGRLAAAHARYRREHAPADASDLQAMR